MSASAAEMIEAESVTLRRDLSGRDGSTWSPLFGAHRSIRVEV
jgi:hypothetical protein